MLETTKSLVDSSLLESHPPWIMPIGRTRPTNLSSHSEWKQFLSVVIKETLERLPLARKLSLPILAPFVDEKYVGELSWSVRTISWRQCYL